MKPRKTKYNALRVPCPRCGAYEWRPCIGKGERERKAFHTERHLKARGDAGKPKPFAKAKYGPEWAATRAKVFAEKGAACFYCGDAASHVDHLTPKARGGTDDLSNLVPACATCNVAKGMMTLEEWRGS